MDNVFGKRLRELRFRFDMNKKEFAEKVGVTYNTLSAYENGIKNPSIQIATKIARSCGASLDWMCGIMPSENLTETQLLQQFGMAFAPESPFRIERESTGRAVVSAESAEDGIFLDKVIKLSSAASIGVITHEMYRTCIEVASRSKDEAQI